MSWPTPQEYNEAIQNPHLNFADEELKCGTVELNQLGLPQPSTGAFASVYRLKCSDRDVAVRCFLQSVSDQPARYKALSENLKALNHDLFVKFEYVEQGIKVGNTWHPVVKMDWVNGQTLDEYVRKHCRERELMLSLRQKFEVALTRLNDCGIAHGDLQHGNILVHDGKLRLIDYDGTFVETIAHLGSNELGHPNYQHPGRSKALFSSSMDNFSAWVIQQSLIALEQDPELLATLHGCEECLIWRHIDYAHPARSAAFHIMEQSENEIVRDCGRKLRSLCALSPNAVPDLGGGQELPQPILLSAKPDMSQLMSLIMPGEHLEEEEGTDPFSHLPVSKAWPTLREFSQAIAKGALTFGDEELKNSKPFKRNKSIWRQLGREAVIFPMQSQKKRFAVKCFLSDDPTRAERYGQIEAYFKKGMPWRLLRQTFVPFEYISEGIKIDGNWYPILKMEWLPAATPLDEYISSTPHNKYLAYALADQWRDVMNELQKAGISHGNLESSNILMHEGNLKLVDYDTMFVPSMTGKYYEPPIFSNADLSHPQASKAISRHGDHFAAWLIDTAIIAWALDPKLFEIVENQRGQLLFRSSDFSEPATSHLFALLHHNYHEELAVRAELLYRFLHTPLNSIPPLQAKALPLLPVETKRRYQIRKREVSGRTAALVICIIGVMVLAALPNGSTFALIPLIALILTLRSIVLDHHKKKTGTP